MLGYRHMQRLFSPLRKVQKIGLYRQGTLKSVQFIVGVLCGLLMSAGHDQNAQSKALFASSVYVSCETGEADRGKNNVFFFSFFKLRQPVSIYRHSEMQHKYLKSSLPARRVTALSLKIDHTPAIMDLMSFCERPCMSHHTNWNHPLNSQPIRSN